MARELSLLRVIYGFLFNHCLLERNNRKLKLFIALNCFFLHIEPLVKARSVLDDPAFLAERLIGACKSISRCSNWNHVFFFYIKLVSHCLVNQPSVV